MMERTSVVSRNTKETEIQISFNLDGSGKADIQTGIGFFDHMLNSFARHGFFDLTVKAKGDLEVDTHHTIEDTGIVLGQAIKQAVGDKKGIVRYGSQILPMDESLVLCALDLCGRPYLVYDLDLDRHHTIEDIGIVMGEAIAKALGEKTGIARYGHFLLPMDEALILCAVDLGGRPYLIFDAVFRSPACGDMDTQMVREFFYAVSYAAEMNLHIRQMAGMNNHHIIEAAFKAFAKALDSAVAAEPRLTGVLSTKGSL